VGSGKVYIHEEVEILGQNRAAYIEHACVKWAPIGRAERNMLCVGSWATVGSTEHWPQVVNMWELDGFEGLAASFRHELSHTTHQDPALTTWWTEASKYRRGGYDRILVPSDATPSLEDAMARGIRGEVYMHEVVTTVRSAARDYVARVDTEWGPRAADLGLTLVGAYRHAMADDSEAIVLWAIDTWETWAEVERALDEGDAAAAWRRSLDGVVVSSRRKLLAPGPWNPLETGTIP
jgi:hypothetical protein